MRPDRVEVTPPAFDDDLSLAQRVEDFTVEQFIAKMRELRVGDPMDEATDIGPLATEQIRKGVHEQVQKTVEAGAKLLLGGRMINMLAVSTGSTRPKAASEPLSVMPISITRPAPTASATNAE